MALRELINRVRFEVDYSGLDEARRALLDFQEEVQSAIQAVSALSPTAQGGMVTLRRALGEGTNQVSALRSALQEVQGETERTGSWAAQVGSTFAQAFSVARGWINDARNAFQSTLRDIQSETERTGAGAERAGSFWSRFFSGVQSSSEDAKNSLSSLRERIDALGESFSRLGSGIGAFSLFRLTLGATAGAALYAATMYEHARIQAEAMTESARGNFQRLADAVQRTVRETKNFISEGDLFGVVAQAQKFGLSEEMISEHLRDIVRVAIATGSDVQSVLQGIAFSVTSGFTRGLRGILALDQLTQLQRMRLAQLSAEERAQVILNMVRERSLELTDAEMRAIESSWGRVQRFKATVQDFFEVAGGVLLPPVMAGLEVITRTLSFINETPLGKIAGGLMGILATVTLLGAGMRALRGGIHFVIEGLQVLSGTRIGAWFTALTTGVTSARGALLLFGRALPLAGIYLLIESLIRLGNELGVFRALGDFLKPVLDIAERLSKPVGMVMMLAGAMMLLRGQVIGGLGAIGFGLSLYTSGATRAAKETDTLSAIIEKSKGKTEEFGEKVDWLTTLLRKLGLQADDTGESLKKTSFALPAGLTGVVAGAVTGAKVTPGGPLAKVGGALVGGVIGGISGAQIGQSVTRDVDTGAISADFGKFATGVLTSVTSGLLVLGARSLISKVWQMGQGWVESLRGLPGKVAADAAQTAGKIILPGTERAVATGKIILPSGVEAEATQAATRGIRQALSHRVSQAFAPATVLRSAKGAGIIGGVIGVVSELLESGSIGRSIGAGVDTALGMGIGSALGGAIGTLLLPGVGTAVGGMLGGVLGSLGTGMLGLFKRLGGWVEEKITGRPVGPREARAAEMPVLHTPDFLKQGSIASLEAIAPTALSLSIRDIPTLQRETERVFMLERTTGRQEDIAHVTYMRFMRDKRKLSPEMLSGAHVSPARGGMGTGAVNVSVAVNVPIVPPTDVSRLDWGEILGKYRTQLEEFTTEFFLRELEVGMKRLPPDDTHYHRPN